MSTPPWGTPFSLLFRVRKVSQKNILKKVRFKKLSHTSREKVNSPSASLPDLWVYPVAGVTLAWRWFNICYLLPIVSPLAQPLLGLWDHGHGLALLNVTLFVSCSFVWLVLSLVPLVSVL